MKENLKQKFKSWALWLALGALIVYCAKIFFGIDISDEVNGFLNVVLPVLIAFGIVNNPNNRSDL